MNYPDTCPIGGSNLGNRFRAELDVAKCLLEGVSPAVIIYGGSRVKVDDPYYAATEALAKALSERGIAVMSGGGPGIMEAANKGAQSGKNGVSIGLNITLTHEPEPNDYQDVSVNFNHFAARKTAFCKYAGAYVVMPGGFGTLDELFEVLTLIQTGKTPAKPVILYGAGFWSGLLTWMEEQMLARGFISANDAKLYVLVDSVPEALRHCLP